MDSESELSDSGFDWSSRWSVITGSSSVPSSPAPADWLIGKPPVPPESKPPPNIPAVDDEKGSKASEMKMMKERFSRLLLGEDMSGSGNGVCTALTLSNAITNLYATVFGQLWKLEPLEPQKKSMWKREMGWLLCVCDYIGEMIPSWHTLPEGRKVEVMSTRTRLDIDINLPALRKLDNMLLEILDGFSITESEFSYIDQGLASSVVGKSDSFRKTMERQEKKWWLPVPHVPPRGLREQTRNDLSHKLECVSQILKAVSAINSSVLDDMEVPMSYSETLPKSGRACLGDFIYRYITSEEFSSEVLLDYLNISSEHAALDLVNHVEAAIYVWIKRLHSKHSTKTYSYKSSWEIVREFVRSGEKNALLVERGENLLRSIKHRHPGLMQSNLETSKIQGNKDVGKAILECYSRVLESLAFIIMARIDDLLYVDDVAKRKFQSGSLARGPFPGPVSGSNYQTAHATRPASISSHGEGSKSRFMSSGTVSSKHEPKATGLDSCYVHSLLDRLA